jgi:hypothetical protein
MHARIGTQAPSPSPYPFTCVLTKHSLPIRLHSLLDFTRSFQNHVDGYGRCNVASRHMVA